MVYAAEHLASHQTHGVAIYPNWHESKRKMGFAVPGSREMRVRGLADSIVAQEFHSSAVAPELEAHPLPIVKLDSRVDTVSTAFFCCGVSLFFVEQGPKYIRKQWFFVDGVRLSQIGFVATGALSTWMWLSFRVPHMTGSLRFSSLTAASSVRM
jgi:hypothetical protein